MFSSVNTTMPLGWADPANWMVDPYFIFDFPIWPTYAFASLLGLLIVLILFRFIHFDKKYWLCWVVAVLEL